MSAQCSAWCIQSLHSFANTQETCLQKLAKQCPQAPCPLITPHPQPLRPHPPAPLVAPAPSRTHSLHHPTNLCCYGAQGLLEVMASAEQVGGPSAEVSTLLAVCIRDSLESAFQWHIEQTAKDADNDAVRICLLAKATVNLLGIEVTTFSPALVPYLPIAADVAAKALHELFGSQLLPWLATGTLQ